MCVRDLKAQIKILISATRHTSSKWVGAWGSESPWVWERKRFANDLSRFANVFGGFNRLSPPLGRRRTSLISRPRGRTTDCHKRYSRSGTDESPNKLIRDQRLSLRSTQHLSFPQPQTQHHLHPPPPPRQKKPVAGYRELALFSHLVNPSMSNIQVEVEREGGEKGRVARKYPVEICDENLFGSTNETAAHWLSANCWALIPPVPALKK